VLNGRKDLRHQWSWAQAALVFAQTDPARPTTGSAPHRGEGHARFTVVKTEDKLGIRASDTAEVPLRELPGAVENRLGDEGEGSRSPSGLDGGGLGIAAQAVGIAVAATKHRWPMRASARASACPSASTRGAWMLATLATGIEAARS